MTFFVVTWLVLGQVDSDLSFETSSRGELALEGRAFDNDHRSQTVDNGLGFFGRLEVQGNYGPVSTRLRGYGRMDRQDRDRNVLVPEEAWVQLRKDWLRVRFGYDILNWTATEAFHPTDIINARNLDSDLENYEKIGEPIAALQVVTPWETTFEILGIAAHTEPILTSPHSRLSLLPANIRLGAPIFVNHTGHIASFDHEPQGALRIRQVLAGADVSLQLVQHVDRSQPYGFFDSTSDTFRPVFQTVRHIGITYQQALDALLIKVEAAYRHFIDPRSVTGLNAPERDHATLAAGLEYGLTHANGSETTLLAEGQMVLGLDKADRVLLSAFQRDVLAGIRYALNDEDGRELMLIGIVDVDGRREGLVSLNYTQRIGETFSLRAGLRIIEAGKPKGIPRGLQSLRDADMLRLTLTRHF